MSCMESGRVYTKAEAFHMARCNLVVGLVLGGGLVGAIVGFLWAVTS